MNARHSLGLHLESIDPTAQLAAFRGIANRALSLAIFTAQRVLKQDEEERNALHDDEQGSTLDERNTLDESRITREPPVGLEPQPDPRDALKFYASVYATGLHYCIKLGESDYDLPQDPKSRIEWNLTRAKENLRMRPQTALRTTAEKLAFAARVSQAKSDVEFWSKHAGAVKDLVEDAVGSYTVPEDSETVLDTMQGVDAFQFAVQAGIGLSQTRARLELSAQRFKPSTIIGRRIIGDLALLEQEAVKMKEFIATLEEAYSNDIYAAVKAGRNLLVAEAMDEAYASAIDRIVQRAMATQDEATAATATA